ncbi:CD109 antigen-like isoform X3 [Ruditapes philippinarum]|uniref:CD109 antigen-like isoform X3 n=1 Tax=Ruditapes philippinarum TaxID=129788 RepID=UPI00295A894B|nr:CD109 antigen-like isoform X3 [Ruditapes philippinarum]
MSKIFFLATVLAVALADDSYVVLTPSSFRGGLPLSVSVNILKATAPVSVTVSLVNEGSKTTVATATGSFSKGTPGTLQLLVPDDVHAGSYKLHVTGSGGATFTNETTITFESKSISLFIQTDKAMYKPGQTVNFRAFAVFPNLTVYTGPMDIDIYDPATNKIKQWRGLSDPSGVVTKFMLMDSQPVLGDWKIKVMAHGRSEEKAFTVAHYVLPKFEVTVELPTYILSSDDTVTGKVKATYTYGKPVKGTVDIRLKIDHWYRPYNYHGDEPQVTQTLSIDGEASFTMQLSQIKQAAHYLTGHSFLVEANVTESLNSITLNGDSQVKIYDHAVKLEYLPSNPNTFKPGLPYTAYLKVVQQDDTPITGKRESLIVKVQPTWQENSGTSTPYPWYSAPQHSYYMADQTFTVPDAGIVPIQVDIPENSTHINVEAHYGKIVARLSLSKSYSPSDNYMQLFLKSSSLRPGQTATFEIKSTETIPSAVYQVMSRGSVVATGSFNGNNFNIPIDAEMAPNARIIVYYVRTDGEVVTDSISFDVDGAFQNQVTIDFDKSKAQPGENVNVIVKADPQSVVNLLAVDQSVLLLKSGNDVTASEVIDELKSYDTIKHARSPFCCDFMPMAVNRRKRFAIWWPYPVYYGGSDAQDIFDNSGVRVMTDATVYHHVEQHYYYPLPGMINGGPMMAMAGGAMPNPIAPMAPNSASGMKTVEKVRSVFPETWLWTDSIVKADGTVTINTTIPDTITSWVASAFAVNSASGLGVASSTAKVEAFKPFFVSLNLPYSVVRGEQLALQANVFNYMSQDLDVVVTLEQSNDFKNVIVDSSGTVQYVSQQLVQNIHVAAGAAKSVFFPIVPAALGKIPITVKAQSILAADAVRRQLLIEPEGVAKEYSNPILIDLKNVTSFSKDVALSLPAGVVAGSQRVVVSAIGDLMGPTVNNLDKLLRMPTGCGEQTMLGFAPDVFVTNYLTATNQLTGDIEQKALNFLEKGYQRELTFQHKDGSFSAFGDRDKSGSMWLSAFVTKSFHQAKKQIFIDDDTIKRAIDWMVSKQNADGSFPEPGRVIHKDMQGGSASGLGLTAFVLISLLENNDLGGSIQQRINNAVTKATGYVESQLSTTTDDYALAISSFALRLAKSSSADTAYAKLNNDAIVKDGMRHWHKAQTSSSSHNYWRPSHSQANPIDIEMTSYALLVQAAKQDFGNGIPIMKWITSQRNSNGGFASTQDTVIGLQALSEFAVMAYSDNFDIQATITAGTFTHKFSINKQNALVLQTVVLPSVPSQVSVTATGHGMALVDINLSFHVEQEIEEKSFDVTVTMVQETVDFLSIKTCATWLKTGASGMAVQEFGIPSGFEADLESIAGVAEIKKVESEDRKVILYFDEITTEPICLTMDVIRTGMVAKSQPATVRVYDYYQPSNQVTAFYESHVLKNSDICDVCADCGCKGAQRR